MTTSATKEFTVGTEKYTPRRATVNGIAGRIWTMRKLHNGAWVHQAKKHVRTAAGETEVMASFVEDNEIDHDSVDEFWN